MGSEINGAPEVGRLLHRPIYGGVFGYGKYALATMPGVSRGLHCIRYMVVDPRAGAVLSIGEEKADALADARRVIVAGSVFGSAANDSREPEQLKIWADGELPLLDESPAAKVTRRRREIFQKSEGRCHYCATPLTLDGKWHVEHMMPRALGGTDDPLNLVAACTQCNHAKSDRTALEFVAKG